MSDLLSLNKPSLVVFDLFGTLIKYGVMHHPFRQLLIWARENGRSPKADDARRLMTIDGDVPKLAAALGISAPEWLITQLQEQIQTELNSLTLYEDVMPTLIALRDLDIPFAVCSNLATPYGQAVIRLLGDFQFIQCLSYEVGAIKPDREIYDWIIDRSGILAKDILFVGDTRLADYEGPIEYGFSALHIVRGQPAELGTIGSLLDMLSRFK